MKTNKIKMQIITNWLENGVNDACFFPSSFFSISNKFKIQFKTIIELMNNQAEGKSTDRKKSDQNSL